MLEVSHGEVLIQADSSLIAFDLVGVISNCAFALSYMNFFSTYSFLVLTQGSVDNTHIEEDLGGIGDAVELLQSFVEFIVVVTAESRYPRLDFLCRVSVKLSLATD